MTERYFFEYPQPGECLIFDRMLGSSARSEPFDRKRAVLTCKDPEMAGRVVDLLNEEEDVKALAREGAFDDKENTR